MMNFKLELLYQDSKTKKTYKLTMYDGSREVGELHYNTDESLGTIIITDIFIKMQHQHTNKHYGSIILDQALNCVFEDLQDTYDTIYIYAKPRYMSYWRILIRHIDCVDIPALLDHLGVESIKDITKSMMDKMQNRPLFKKIFDYKQAEIDETYDLMEFFERFGFKAINTANKHNPMIRSNEVSHVPGIHYTVGKRL
jgi:hypothetical protein